MDRRKLNTQPLDAAKYLGDAAAQAAYFSDALESKNKTLILVALNTLARARGMTALAKATGVKREALYAALSEGGNPTLDTLLAVINGLGLTLKAEAAAEADADTDERVPELA